MVEKLPIPVEQLIKAELDELNKTYLKIDGGVLHPAACYYFNTNPPHILYNTNCPDILKEKIKAIVSKYRKDNEGSVHR